MENKRLVLCGLLLSLVFYGADSLLAEDTSTDWKAVLQSDKAQIAEQKLENKENAATAKVEELELKKQIQEALDAGDPLRAKQLREKLQALHRENVQERIEDRNELKSQVRELKGDIKEAKQEALKHRKLDRDNNPPGPKGGPGTNWENPPGPKGGAGSSPDRKPRFDRDNNPPGPKGGPGTNWENPPGPKGGAGSSPDRRGRGR